MRIPDDLISEFQLLYKNAFGIEINAEEARVQGLAVMRLVALNREQKLSDQGHCGLSDLNN